MAWQFYCPRHYALTMTAVNDFVQKHSFVDVKLVCKNKKTVYSHKLVLASASPFLKTLIEERNNFDDMFTLYLPDFDYNIVTLLLTFLYEGVMKMKLNELNEFRELCNGLCMVFPGADVVTVLNDSNDSQSSTTQQADDFAEQQLANTDRGILAGKSSDVSSRDSLCRPAKVPDTANKDSAVASIIPKIEDCEECENFLSSQPVCKSEPENISQMLDIRHIHQRIDENNVPQTYKCAQTGESIIDSEVTGNSESQRKLLCSQSDTEPDLNLSHGISSSSPDILQSNEMPHIYSLQLMPMSVEQNNFDSNSTVHQTSTTKKMAKRSKATTETSHNGISVEGKQFTQTVYQSSVHKDLPEQTGVISHKLKQSSHLKSVSKKSDTVVHSKRHSVQKSGQAKKRKKM